MQHLFRRFDMPRIVFFIILLGLFWLGLGISPAKASDSTYFVKAVAVDVIDQSSVKARNKAFVEAQKKAFMMLAARFETPETLTTIKPPADNILSGMIQDFEISSEQLSTKRYRGVFDFRFKSFAVNKYFGHGPVRADENAGIDIQKILIVPYYQEGQNAPIFDKTKNMYLASLRAELPKDGTIILPEGNISDTTDIGGQAPNSLSSASIRRLKARYDVQTVFVAVAHVDLKKPQTVKLDIFKAGNGHIDLISKSDVAPNQVAQSTFGAVTAPVLSVADNNPQPLEPEQQTVDASEPVADIQPSPAPISQQASVAPAQTVSGGGEAVVKVFFTSMSEWLSIQKKIREANGGKSIRITSLKTNQVDAVVAYQDWNGFKGSLQGMGLSLEPQPNNSFILKRY